MVIRRGKIYSIEWFRISVGPDAFVGGICFEFVLWHRGIAITFTSKEKYLAFKHKNFKGRA